MAKSGTFYLDKGKESLTYTKMIKYLSIFFLPIAGFFYISVFLSRWVNDLFGYSTVITVRVMMIFFTFIVFLFVIPYIRKRENISGIRSALVGFIIVALVMALPYLIFRKDISVLLSQLTYLASYILLTFIFSPEV